MVNYAFTLDFCDGLFSKVDEKDRAPLCEVLKNDPRPSYQHDPERIYTMDYGKYAVGFRVEEKTLVVTQVTKRSLIGADVAQSALRSEAEQLCRSRGGAVGTKLLRITKEKHSPICR